MNATTRRAALALLVALFALSPLASGRAAAAATISEVGWWTRNPAATAPDSGLNVSNAADGPVSVGAIRVTSTTGLETATLRLPEEGGLQASSAKLQVCPTPNEWTEGAAQAWASAPKAECESAGSVELARGADGVWAADVVSLLGDIEEAGEVSLMVVPAGDAAVPVAFEVRFQPPELQSTASEDTETTYPGSGGSSGGSDSFGSYDPTGNDAGSDPGLGSSGSAGLDSGSFGSTYTPPPATTAVPAVPETPASPPSTAATDADGTGELAALPTQANLGGARDGGSRTVQALFFVLLATLAGVGAGGGRYLVRKRSAELDALVS